MNGLRRNDDEAHFAAGTDTTPLVAIVILNWNGKSFLEKFLPSVCASTYVNKRVIVADNASTDDSISFLEKVYPAIEVIVHESNEGFAKGYNSALKRVQADYFVLLNSDVEVTPGWIEPVIALMERDGLIGACQPKILSYADRNLFEYAGACGGWIDMFGYPFSRGRVFDDLEEDRGQYDENAPCFWASGAAFFVKAKLFREVGGFDEFFFAHQEEIDLCWRLQLAGYKIYVEPTAVVYHVGGGTLAKESPFKTFLNFRNNLIMCSKNLPLSQALWRIPVRLVLDGLAAWRGLAGGSAAYFKAVCKSHFHYVKWLLFEQGKSVFPRDKKDSPAGIYHGSIVWQYFLKKNKSFSQIVKIK